MLAQPAGLACEAGMPVAPRVMVATALVVVARGRMTWSGTGLDEAKEKREMRPTSTTEAFMLKLGIRDVG
jgi:hypothetical protein